MKKLEQLKEVHFFMQEVLRKSPSLDFFGFTFNTNQYDIFFIRENDLDQEEIKALRMTCKAHKKKCQVNLQEEIIRIIINDKKREE